VGLHEPVARTRNHDGPHARRGHGRGRTPTSGRSTGVRSRSRLHDRDASDAWYRNTVEIDRTRIAQINALIGGRPALQPTDPPARIRNALLVAMMHDADLFRAYAEIVSLLALPQEVMARPGVIDRIMEVAGTHEAVTPPSPSRDELLRMLA
jgi:hypothetical protein